MHGPRQVCVSWLELRLVFLQPVTIGDLGLSMLGHQVQGEDCHQERESTDAITLAVLDASADKAIEKRKA